MASHEAAKQRDIDQSSNEKAGIDAQLENGVGDQYPYDGQLPPDPDAHMSAEEKAAIVSSPRSIKFPQVPRIGLTIDQDRKLLWKLDLTLIPWLCILYLLAFLDRTNIGNAKIDGLQKSLHKMTTGQYNATLSIFFVSYSVFEPLTNILLKRLRPSVFIPIIMYAALPHKLSLNRATC